MIPGRRSVLAKRQEEVKRTITHRGMLAICLAAALVLSWTLPDKADAATQLGQVSPDGSFSDGPINLVQNIAVPDPYAVPAGGGVITRWSHRGKSGNAGSGRLQVWRFVQQFDSTFQYDLVGRSALEEFSPGLNTFPTRIPVNGLDRLGLRAGVGAGGFFGSTVGNAAAGDTNTSDPAVGATRNFTTVGHVITSPFRVNVSALLEPDADADGFGDETQDDCPTDASTQGSCPPDDGSPLPSNEFSFGKVKKNKRKGTAKLPVSVALPPGELELARTKKVKGATERVDARATAKLPIRPRRKAKEKLNETGKAKVTAEVTYTSDAGGTPNTRSKKLKLKKR